MNFTKEEEDFVCKVFGGSLCRRCRVIVCLGAPDPPQANTSGKPTAWDGSEIGLLAMTQDHDDTDEAMSGPVLAFDCVLCQKICAMLPQEHTVEHAKVALARLIDHGILGPKKRLDPSLPYDRLVIEVKSTGPGAPPFLDMELGLVAPKPEQFPRIRRILPDKIDYDLVRGWLHHCGEDHEKCSRSKDGKIPIPGFQVIDCLTKSIATAPSGEFGYVALSYVWGQQQTADPDSSVFPRTIEDSIAVTLALGFQYLWVDRYTDPINKHIQIGMMDLIYSQAAITLIATAYDADYGLPGVSSRLRHPQKDLNIGLFQLASFTSLDRIIVNSVWAQRGWTFQEGCLSNRKLLFTDHGIVFLCGGMQRWETIDQEVTEEDGNNRGAISRLEQILPDVKTVDLEPRISILLEEYSKRTLSFDEDALQACLGMLKGMGVTHHWGIQVTKAINPEGGPRPLVMDLYWRNYSPAEKRIGFPTWSWASCRERKDFGESAPFAGDACEIEIQDTEGRWIDATALARDPPGDLSTVTPGQRLRVNGPMIKSRWIAEEGKTYIEVPGSTERLVVFLDTVDESTLLHGDAEELVIETNFNDLTPILMLLEPHGEHYRRIGIAQSLEPRRLSLAALRMAGSHAAWMEHSEIRTIVLE
ncbi:hypothetical protein LA080_010078 [Diaporthe eres]|nr:hypothetical protein LA080_010078 [Diaporthe eres]